MLVCEYNYAEDIATQREEERQIAFAQGIERGFSDGSYQAKLETAIAFKKMGVPIEIIAKGTGLRQADIEKL